MRWPGRWCWTSNRSSRSRSARPRSVCYRRNGRVGADPIAGAGPAGHRRTGRRAPVAPAPQAGPAANPPNGHRTAPRRPARPTRTRWSPRGHHRAVGRPADRPRLTVRPPATHPPPRRPPPRRRRDGPGSRRAGDRRRPPRPRPPRPPPPAHHDPPVTPPSPSSSAPRPRPAPATDRRTGFPRRLNSCRAGRRSSATRSRPRPHRAARPPAAVPLLRSPGADRARRGALSRYGRPGFAVWNRAAGSGPVRARRRRHPPAGSAPQPAWPSHGVGGTVPVGEPPASSWSRRTDAGRWWPTRPPGRSP